MLTPSQTPSGASRFTALSVVARLGSLRGGGRSASSRATPPRALLSGRTINNRSRCSAMRSPRPSRQSPFTDRRLPVVRIRVSRPQPVRLAG
ncbi:hypothetical protein WR25_22102 [Diploscapter pachys]|uniref:Uncharacterized protein n=1 Tax=Diploscapter pachys TaxID=2018661 RepID=A0A2A2K6P5_9BILA|nr:hypothetical protein WR25_22102 [Diploscapter pachys]